MARLVAVDCSRDRLEIAGVNSVSAVTTVQLESAASCEEWFKAIQRNIAAQNALSVSV